MEEPVEGPISAAEPPKTTDSQLVAAVCAGDQQAFQLLFERHRHSVARMGYRFFQRREETEEIVQETFLRAYFALNAFRGEHELSFIAWLSRIAVRSCYDELRRRQRRSEYKFSDLSDDEVVFLNHRARDLSAGRNVETALSDRDLVAKLLVRLKPEDRVVLTLLNVEERSVAEICELTGWTAGKVKMRAMRARKALRTVLKRLM